MGALRLMRKARVNRSRVTKRNQVLKNQSRRPVIKRVDVEAIKAEFEKNKAAQAPQKAAAKAEKSPEAETAE